MDKELTILIRKAEQEFRYQNGSPAEEDQSVAYCFEIAHPSNEKVQAPTQSPNGNQQPGPPSSPFI